MLRGHHKGSAEFSHRLKHALQFKLGHENGFVACFEGTQHPGCDKHCPIELESAQHGFVQVCKPMIASV